MNAPTRHPIATRMFGDALIADASKVSPQEFLAVALDRLFPEPPKTRISERAEASRRYISAAWVAKDVPALRAAYLRELDAIDERYGLTEVRAARHFGKTGVGA